MQPITIFWFHKDEKFYLDAVLAPFKLLNGNGFPQTEGSLEKENLFSTNPLTVPD